VGYRWPWHWTYWSQLPRFWWQIRTWFGLSRAAAYWAGAGLLLAGVLGISWLAGRKPKAVQSSDVVSSNL
jgi:hypothetical protein